MQQPICKICQNRVCEKRYGKRRGQYYSKCHRCRRPNKINTKSKKLYDSLGITRKDVEKVKVCPICNEPMKNPCADHCHKTGKFRGVICRRCNTLLGYAKDNCEILLAAAEYLKSAGAACAAPSYPEFC